MEQLKTLIKVIRPKKYRINARLGFEDPATMGKALEGKETSINVSVDKDGYYYIGESEIPADKIVDKLKAIISANPELSVTISGDTSTEYGRVIGLMALLKEAGFEKRECGQLWQQMLKIKVN